MVEVLYHHAKFGGARILSAAGVSKNVEFFCLSVCSYSVKTTEQLLWFPMQVRYFSASYWKGSE